MNSPTDQPAGAPEEPGHQEEPAPSRIYVPEGPRWDAWVAPDGGAVTLSALAIRMEVRWLRRVRPRPFGFAPGSAHPEPVHIGEAHGAGTLSSGVASALGFRTPVHTMSMSYGDLEGDDATAAEVISDFHRDYQDRDLTEALLAYADSDSDSDGEQITSQVTEIAVLGRQRPVTVLRAGEFSAFQAGEDGVLVTVLARNMGTRFPEIVRLSPADLEPVLLASESVGRRAISDALTEQRRQHIEQMRGQNPD